MSSTRFETESSSSGRRFYIQVWYGVYYIHSFIHSYILTYLHTHNCIKTREQKDLIKRRINKQMNLQDNKQELITKYRKVYSEFIESIDFEQLQQGDKED